MRVRRAEPRVKLMRPPLCQNIAGRFIREHHRRALDAALTSAPDSLCSNKVPTLPPPSHSRRGRGCDYEGVGICQLGFVCFVYVRFFFFFSKEVVQAESKPAIVRKEDAYELKSSGERESERARKTPTDSHNHV